MSINFKSNTKESLLSLKNSLFGNLNSIECKAHPFNKFGKIAGDIVGGNLSILLIKLKYLLLFALINSTLFPLLLIQLSVQLYHFA